MESQRNWTYGLEDKEDYELLMDYITWLEDFYLENGGG